MLPCHRSTQEIRHLASRSESESESPTATRIEASRVRSRAHRTTPFSLAGMQQDQTDRSIPEKRQACDVLVQVESTPPRSSNWAAELMGRPVVSLRPSETSLDYKHQDLGARYDDYNLSSSGEASKLAQEGLSPFGRTRPQLPPPSHFQAYSPYGSSYPGSSAAYQFASSNFPANLPVPRTLPPLSSLGHESSMYTAARLLQQILEPLPPLPDLPTSPTSTGPKLSGSGEQVPLGSINRGILSPSTYQYDQNWFSSSYEDNDESSTYPGSNSTSTSSRESSSSRIQHVPQPESEVIESAQDQAPSPAPSSTSSSASNGSISRTGRKRRCDAPGEDGEPVDASRRTHVCEQCHHTFARPSALKTHMRSHSKEKPFTCPLESCGKSFGVFSNLKRHAKLHSDSELDMSKVGLSDYQKLEQSGYSVWTPHHPSNLGYISSEHSSDSEHSC